MFGDLGLELGDREGGPEVSSVDQTTAWVKRRRQRKEKEEVEQQQRQQAEAEEEERRSASAAARDGARPLSGGSMGGMLYGNTTPGTEPSVKPRVEQMLDAVDFVHEGEILKAQQALRRQRLQHDTRPPRGGTRALNQLQQ